MVFVPALTENCFLARNDIDHTLPNQEIDFEASPAPYGNTGCSGKVRKFILFSVINTYLQAQFRRWKSGNGRDTSVQQEPGAKVLSRKRMRINGLAHFSPYRFSNVFSLRVIVDAGNNSILYI